MSKDNIILNKLLSQVIKHNASELHLTVGEYPILRVADNLVAISEQEVVTNEFMKDVVARLLNKEQHDRLYKKKSECVVYTISEKLRFKVNVFFQKGSLAISFRLISNDVLDFKQLGLSKAVEKLANLERGLIIIAGLFDSGKTTTAAAFVEYVNNNKSKRILTLEKPLEYIFTNNKSIIEQREVGVDTPSFVQGLRDSLMEDIDMVVVSELTNAESLSCVLDLVESGRLVVVQAEAGSSEEIINKLVRYFHNDERGNIRIKLAESLEGIVVQRLVPRIGGGRIVALEVVIANNPVKALIKEDRISQLNNLITISRAEGMINLDTSLAELVKTNEILIHDALRYALKPDSLGAC